MAAGRIGTGLGGGGLGTSPNMRVTQKVFNTACGVRPRDKRAEFHAGTWAMLVICVAAVAARLAQNRFPRRWAWDDFFILLSLAASVAFWYITARGVDELGNPTAVDVWALTHDEITVFLKLVYIFEMLYLVDVCALKTSFLFFFLRIFCPLGTYPTFLGVQLRTLIIRTMVFNLVWGLNMSVWRKGGLTIMFTFGTFATVVNVFRILVINKFSRKDNVTRNNWDLLLWSSLEIAVGTVCACLPSLRIACLVLYRRVSRLLPGRPREMSRNRRRSPAPRAPKSSRTVTVCSAPPVRLSIMNSGGAGQDRLSRQASSKQNTITETLRPDGLSREGEGRRRDEQEWEEQHHSASQRTGRWHRA
ncbi:hypothetical protein RB595_000458 [Gaeumannomyces hyphopodioides]